MTGNTLTKVIRNAKDGVGTLDGLVVLVLYSVSAKNSVVNVSF